MKRIQIHETRSSCEQEPLVNPFGFKGDSVNELWQTASWLKSTSGVSAIGLCTQNVLWADANLFKHYTEQQGNQLMYSITRYALELIKGRTYSNPMDLMDEIWSEVMSYAHKITGVPDLRETFVLNALVGVDIALWRLYAAENNISSFDQMIPEKWRPAVSFRNNSVACVPLISYAMPLQEVIQLTREGYYLLKIKLGQPGTQQEMLKKDTARMSAVHNTIGQVENPSSPDGKIHYYFDANGRYENQDTLMKLMDHAQNIGALEQITLLEEPFPEDLKIDVRSIPVRIAADESAHSETDTLERIQLGYGAIALKPIAKTLSMTLKIANLAMEHSIPCFCADLTVNPVLVDWNKNIAARLAPFPGIGAGLLETNGHQLYRNWKIMESYHPYPTASWRTPQEGRFFLNNDFYSGNGGILEDTNHYRKMFDC